MSNATYKNILIIKPSALGDIAISLFVLKSLKQSFPDANVTWFVRPEFAPLLDAADHLDSMIIFDRKLLGKWWRSPKAFAELCRLFKQLRQGRFDLVIDLQGLFRTALFAWLTGSKKRFGMLEAREFANSFYTHKIAKPKNSLHVRDYYAEILTAADTQNITFASDLAPSQEALANVEELLSTQKLPASDYVVFIPGAAHYNKCWPTGKFALLAEKINSDFSLPVVLAGGTKEKKLAKEIISAANTPIVDLTGQTDIVNLIALLTKARLVVTNDTGPGHIAVYLNTPTVMLFGPTNPARIRPYKRDNSVVAIDPDTRGSEIENQSPEYAIENLPVDLVFEKVTAQLKA
jgi:lipopolysaccharide heptosyltransferase I